VLDGLAMEKLQAYAWPGNVRELENLVRRLTALYSEELIGPQVITAELAEARHHGADPDGAAGDSLGAAVESHLSRYFSAHADALPPTGLYQRVLREVERPLIALSLTATRGNQLQAAKLLGLNRNTLRKKIREFDIPLSRGVE
jgi:two-component system nitrogen regulation response regulator GlnG